MTKAARSSRQRYRSFVLDYKQRRLGDPDRPSQTNDPAESEHTRALDPGKRREYLREYVRWLRPHRYSVGGVFLLALTVAGFQMIEPLFMRRRRS